MKNERYISLDLLRGLAAVGVVFFHAFLTFDVVAPLFVLVDFFFVLSGFVLEPLYPKNQADHKETKRFVLKRALRFFPMSICSLVLSLVWFLIFQNDNQDPKHQALIWLSASLLLQMLFTEGLKFNHPLWSLSAEWITNLFAIPVLARNKDRLLIFAIAAGYALLLYPYLFNGDALTFMTLERTLCGLGRAMIGFFIGVLIRKKFESLRNSKLLNSRTVVIVTIAVIYASMYFTLSHKWIAIFWMAPLFVVPIIYFAHRNSALQQSWMYRPAVILGNLSFGIYVWQELMRKVALTALENLNISGEGIFIFSVQFIVTLALSILATIATQRFVEKPIQKKFAYKPQSQTALGKELD